MIATHTPSEAAPLRQRARQPVSDFGPGRRAPLEILPDGYLSPRSRRRRARLAAAAGILLACSMLFGLAGVHVLLTQGEFRLAHYQTKADAEEARYVRLRETVAELESPGRIVATAQQKLGMVPPASLTYLTALGPFTGPSSVGDPRSTVGPPSRKTPGHLAAGDTARSLQDWAKAKPALPSGR